MMDRGSFNGPGGPHMRWVVPANMGAAMPAGLMLRNRMVNGFISEKQVLTISRGELAKTGPVIASVTARAVEPDSGSFAGIIVRLDGAEPHDRTPADDPAVNPLSTGTAGFDFYSIEVVQRIGYDSFCPDNGVLIAKNKDKESRNGGPNGFNCFNWVIDAHPEDINMVDYVRPDGKKIMRTIADYRQLNDALFHAGVNSGSFAEWVDEPNRLHFYILDLNKNDQGILSYKIGIRSLDGSADRKDGIKGTSLTSGKIGKEGGYIFFTVKSTGEKTGTGKPDIFRISSETDTDGWLVEPLNSFFTLSPGESIRIPVYAGATSEAPGKANITVSIQSETSPDVKFTLSKSLKKP